MRCLVTGGAGFVGSNLAKRLATDGHDVVALDDFQSGAWENLVDFAGDVVTLDLSGDIAALKRLGRFQVIFHQASITDTTVTDQFRMMHNNAEAFRQLLDYAADAGSRVVWASSAATYGREPAPHRESAPPKPLNVYGYSKLAMERLAKRYQQKFKSPIVGLRYFNVYGPGEAHKQKFASMIWQLAQQMAEGKRPRIFTDGSQQRDFVYVDDCVQANLRAMEATMEAAEPAVFNVGSGKARSFNDIVAALNKTLGTNLEPEYFECPYDVYQDHTEADLSQSREKLGYDPQYGLEKGIAAYHESGALVGVED